MKIEANAALHLIIEDAGFYQSEGGRAVVMTGRIGSAVLTAVKASGAADVIQVNASYSDVTGGQIFTLTDTWTYMRHHVLTGTQARANWVNTFRLTASAGNDLLIWDGPNLTGGSADDVIFYKYGTGAVTFMGPSGTTLSLKGGNVGFFGATPAAKPTGVAVTAVGIHAALVRLGLIAG